MPDLSSEHFRQVMAHVPTSVVVVAGVVEGRQKGLSVGTFVPVSPNRSDSERVVGTGDHVLVLGRVLGMGVETGQTPLLHHRSSCLGVSEATGGAAGSE
ncbi:MAG: flavin reductase family protein [Acidimicrobiales bacterium]